MVPGTSAAASAARRALAFTPSAASSSSAPRLPRAPAPLCAALPSARRPRTGHPCRPCPALRPPNPPAALNSQPLSHPAPGRTPARPMSAAASTAASAAAPADDLGPLVQYVVVRKDLRDGLGWPMGSVIAQGCHASLAAAWEHREDDSTQEYLSPEKLASMHKVVLEIKGETQLNNLATKLMDAGVKFHLWREQPEDYPTALATKPYYKGEVSQYFKKLNLCK